MQTKLTSTILAAALALGFATSAHAALIISEVHSTGSGNSTYGKDWFELTNTGTSAFDLTGAKVDDNSALFASSLALRGVTSIAAGQSVVFIETDAAGSTDATVTASFISAWFGASAPVGFTIGTYGGSGIGLSSNADAVNIYSSVGDLITGVVFGAGTTGFTFDNATGATGAISTLSVVGVNGAFTSVTGGEVGSPGVIASAVPEPSSYALFAGFGSLALVALRRRRSSRAA